MSLLANTEKSWVSTITLDAEGDDITVVLDIPVGSAVTKGEYTETHSFSKDSPSYLVDAARNLSNAMVRYIRERGGEKGEVLCDTCTGACCGRVYSTVNVTPADISRMGSTLATRGVDKYWDGESWTGTSATLKRVQWTGIGKASVGDGLACVFLGQTVGNMGRCTIYDVRPQVCRDFPAANCGDYEDKRHLPVV